MPIIKSTINSLGRPVNSALFTGQRALVFSPVPTHPATHGNRIRVLHLVQFLESIGFEVHLALLQDGYDFDEAAMRRAFGERLHLVPYTKPLSRRESTLGRFGRHLRQLADVDARHTVGVDDWYDDRTDAALRRLDDTFGFNLAVVEYVFMSRALLALRTPRVRVIDTHDLFANRHRLYLAAGQKPQFFSTSPQEEQRGLKRADLVLGIQAQVTTVLQAYGVNAITFGHTVAIDLWWGSALAQYDLLMVGSSNHMNVQGLLWFGREVLPLLLATQPALRVAVVGGVCAATPDVPGLIKLGVVPDLAAVYACTRLVINPVQSGTGLNIKSVEALGFGMPLLATSSGSRGLDAAVGHAMAVADSPSEFAQAALALLADAETLASLSKGAQVFAKTWNNEQTDTLKDELLKRFSAMEHVE